ncbi:hypothetical protein BDN71DRAFT_1442276 [Pleurotus eryngii]|uniref:Uncharacterized protein n=1 Tax=Pleurotus eryngii TaxID=5323 RepID=A0A9P6A596_PLEER|nr:hypothetical protein BDN71DRAFT_1442276 [Pleurotus eryngii]
MDLTPHCHGMNELPSAATERSRVQALGHVSLSPDAADPLTVHLSHGLAYTVGSALGSIPPTTEACLEAFVVPNKVGLTAGARAWSKHAHRSASETAPQSDEEDQKKRAKVAVPEGWWGRPSGPVKTINERALSLFHRVMDNASWRNLHWLPHQVLVYEVRTPEGYGMRWSQDRGDHQSYNGEDGIEGSGDVGAESPWVLRGFVEPMMEGGHEKGWRH